MPYLYYTGDYGVTAAVVDCITRDGIHNLSIDVIARELRRSRSALYQQFRNWRGLLKSVHSELFVGFNAHAHFWKDDRQEVFNEWWNGAAHDLRTPLGGAFRAIRGLVAEEGGCEALALSEVRMMPRLVRWLDEQKPADKPVLVAHRLWVFMLAAAPFSIGSPAEQTFRRLAQAEFDALPPPATPGSTH